MKSPGNQSTRNTDGKPHGPAVDHDQDWVYSGVIYACPECGHEFASDPPGFDCCPECGGDIWQSEH